MKSVITKQPFWHSIISIAIMIFALYFLCKISINVFSHPYAVNEYREAADVQLTEAFISDDNPYRLESLANERESGMPPVLYQYSFLNSAIGALLTVFTGGDAITALYILSLLSMIGSSTLIYLMIRREVNNTTFPMLGAALTLFCHWRFGYLSTTPNSLGIFMIIFTAFLATSRRLDGRWKLILTALLSVLCFYTKLYYVTVAFGIFVYFFCYSKTEAWKYFGYCIGLGALSILIIQLIWPLYFTYSIYYINGMGLWFIPRTIKLSMLTDWITAGTMTMAVKINFAAFSYAFEQFGYMFVTFAGLFLVLLFSLITGVIKKRRVQIKPNDTLALTVILSIVQGLCLVILGKADGAYLSYFLQLWIPFVIASSMICADKYILNDLLHMDEANNRNKIIKLCGIAFTAFIAFTSIYFGYHKLPLHVMSEDEKSNWQEASDYIEKYAEDKIYYVPELAYLAMMNGDRAYDNGHVAVAGEKGLKTWENDEIGKTVFTYADDIALQNIEYRKEIIEDIKNHEYGLVTLDDYGLLGDREFYLQLEEYGYKCIDTLPLTVGNATYDVEFWAIP